MQDNLYTRRCLWEMFFVGLICGASISAISCACVM